MLLSILWKQTPEREGRTVEEHLSEYGHMKKALRTYLKSLIARLIFIQRIQLNKSSVWPLLRYFYQLHLLQAHSSTSDNTKNDIDMVTKRIRTADISVIDKADRDYLKMSAKIVSHRN